MFHKKTRLMLPIALASMILAPQVQAAENPSGSAEGSGNVFEAEIEDPGSGVAPRPGSGSGVAPRPGSGGGAAPVGRPGGSGGGSAGVVPDEPEFWETYVPEGTETVGSMGGRVPVCGTELGECDPTADPVTPAPAAPAPGAPAPVPPSAAEVQQAVMRVQVPAPRPVFTGSCYDRPDLLECGLYVGMPLWMWVEAQPAFTRTLSLNGFSITASFTPAASSWTLGDGSTVSCTGAGTRYVASDGWKDSPDCGYTYEKRGKYTVGVTRSWNVSWSGVVSGSGTLASSASRSMQIDELQAVVN